MARIEDIRLIPLEHTMDPIKAYGMSHGLMASLPDYSHSDNAPYPRVLEYDVGVNPLRDELLTLPLRAIEGHVPVPGKPGLGIELDPDVVRRYRID